MSDTQAHRPPSTPDAMFWLGREGAPIEIGARVQVTSLLFAQSTGTAIGQRGEVVHLPVPPLGRLVVKFGNGDRRFAHPTEIEVVG